MSKNNKKQHRTDGVFNSNNETYLYHKPVEIHH